MSYRGDSGSGGSGDDGYGSVSWSGGSMGEEGGYGSGLGIECAKGFAGPDCLPCVRDIYTVECTKNCSVLGCSLL